MPEIRSAATTLTHGVCLVDEADLPLVAGWNWWSQMSGEVPYVRGYPIGEWGKAPRMYLHRHLLGAGLWSETRLDVDHVNRNPLDNRRRNLRSATRSQNLVNTVGRPNTSSRFRGVGWNKARGNWRAYIKVAGVYRHLGGYVSEEDAARAFNAAALEAWGERARLNEIAEVA